MADQHPFLLGVVGWLPIADDHFDAQLEQFASKPKLKGLRHVIQDEPDNNYILRPDFNRGISALKNTQLVYDILIFERHLVETIQFVDRHPNQIFVLDHIAKPRIRQGILDPWRTNMAELAKRDNVYWQDFWHAHGGELANLVEDLRLYIDVVIVAFGPNRLMMGSD